MGAADSAHVPVDANIATAAVVTAIDLQIFWCIKYLIELVGTGCPNESRIEVFLLGYCSARIRRLTNAKSVWTFRNIGLKWSNRDRMSGRVFDGLSIGTTNVGHVSDGRSANLVERTVCGSRVRRGLLREQAPQSDQADGNDGGAQRRRGELPSVSGS